MTRDGEFIENMTALIAQYRIKDMARMFHATCPGDWNRGREVAWGGTLYGFYQLDIFPESEVTIYSTIRFRWEAALVDFLVAMYELPMSRNEICIMWDWHSWDVEFRVKTSMSESEFNQRWMAVALPFNCFDFSRLPDQGPRFMRPFTYLVAALLEANKPEHETNSIINAIQEFMQNAQSFHRQRVFASPEVQRKGREWLRSVGRRVRKSLSPRKRSSTTESASCTDD